MFPKDNIPASQKNKDWHLQWGKALMLWHMQNYNAENFPYARMLELIKYLPGDQEVSRHKPNANPLRNNNGFNNIGANYRNLKTAWKILNAVHGKLNKIKIAPDIKQIDSAVSDVREEFKTKIEAMMELRQAEIEIGQYMQQMQISPDDLPMDDDEKQIYLMGKPIIKQEAEMENAISGVFEDQKIDNVRRELRWYLLSVGIAATRIETINNRQYIRAVNPINAGTNVCKYQDFRDLRFSYEVIPMASEVLRAQAGDYFTQQEYDAIDATAGTMTQSPYYRTASYLLNANLTNDKYVFVIDFEVVSTNSIDIETKPNQAGLDITRVFTNGRNPTAEHTDRTLLKMQPQTVYKGKYIIGTDLIWNWGPKEQVAREPIPMREEDVALTNPAKAQLGFKWFQPNLVFGRSVTLLEQMLPHIDILQKTWDQFTNVVYRLVPQAISVDVDSITDISLGKNQKLQPSDVINLLVQHGIDIYSSSVYKGMPNSSANKGAQFKDNPAASNLERLLNSFTAQYNILENMCGIGALVQGGSQSPEIGKAVSQLQSEGTDNVLAGVLDAEINIIEATAKHLMWISQAYGIDGGFKGKPYKIDPATHKFNIYDCKMGLLPSPGEWQALYMDAKAFAQAGQIDYEDTIAIRKIDNFTDAQLYLAWKRKKKERRVRQDAQQNQEATFKGQAAAAQAAEQAKAQTAMIVSQNKQAEIRVSEEEKRKTLIVQKALEVVKDIADLDAVLKQEFLVALQNGNEPIPNESGIPAGEPIPEQQPEQSMEQQPGEQFAEQPAEQPVEQPIEQPY